MTEVRVSQVTGARDSQVTGAKASQGVTGARASQGVTGDKASQEVMETRISQWVIGTSKASLARYQRDSLRSLRVIDPVRQDNLVLPPVLGKTDSQGLMALASRGSMG